MSAVTTNPVDGAGHPMVCRDCRAYRGTVITGLCYGAPPTPLITGIYQDAVGNKSPQIASYMPQVDGNRFCYSFVYEVDKDLDSLPTPVAADTTESGAA